MKTTRMTLIANAFLFLMFLCFFCYGKQLEIMLKTQTYGGERTPKNALALYVQTAGGSFVKTLHVWGPDVNFMLLNWRVASGLLDNPTYDGVTSATRKNHNDTIRLVWGATDANNNPVPDGSYEVVADFTEDDYFWKQMDPNEEYKGKTAKVAITVGAGPDARDGQASVNFPLFRLKYDPNAGVRRHPGRSDHMFFRAWVDRGGRRIVLRLLKEMQSPVYARIVDGRGSQLERIQLFPGGRAGECTDLAIAGNVVFIEITDMAGKRLFPVQPLLMVR